MSGTASALQLPNEGDLAQTSDLSTPKGTDTRLLSDSQHPSEPTFIPTDRAANGSSDMQYGSQAEVVDLTASDSRDSSRELGEIRSPQPTSLAQIMSTNKFSLTTPPSSPGASYPPALQLEYSSSAPMPQTTKPHTVQSGDPDVPSHLYKRLPSHFLHKEEGSDELVPDYMRMILLCRSTRRFATSANFLVAKVYSPPLNLKETPLTLAVNLSGRLGCEVWLKREDLQPVFSFKIRGAYNLMASLSKEERWKGVVTCSAGNHAQGVALAGYHLKIPCTIVMPIGTPSIKWRNVERLGAKVVLHGQDFDEAKTECARLAKTYGLHFIPPYDDPMVVAGQGTVAVELARQIKDFESLDGIFASAGGGGLLAGISAYTKRIAPQMNVIGVETHDGDALKRSLAAGKRVTLQEVGPFADGTAVKIVGEEPFRLCKNLLDDVVLVSNDEICAAIKDVFEGGSTKCRTARI